MPDPKDKRLKPDEQDIRQALEKRLRFEELLTGLSAKFVNLPASDVDLQIENGLKSVVLALEVDRSSFFQLSLDQTDLIVTHSYATEGFDPTPRLRVGKHMPWLMSKLKQGETLPIAKLDDLPDEAALDRKNMKRIHIKSTLCIPITVEESFAYALTLGSLKKERSWDADLIPRLKLIGEVFANAVSRKHAQERIEEHQDQIKDMRHLMDNIHEHSPSIIYCKDLEGRYLLVNRAFADQVGIEPNEIIGKTDLDLFPKENADSYRTADRQVAETKKTMRFDDISLRENIAHAYRSVKFPLYNSKGAIFGVGGVSTDINDLIRAEESLKERLQFQSVASELSAQFMNLPAAKVDQQIKTGLKGIVELFKIDRSTLFRFSRDHQDFIGFHTYAVDGIKQRPKIPIKANLPWFYDQWHQGKAVIFSSLDELPDAAMDDLKHTDLISGAAIPLSIEGSYAYVLTIGSVKVKRIWPEDVVQRLKLIGEIFVNALERQKTDKQISSMLKQLETDYMILREEIETGHKFTEIIGESHGLKYLLHRVSQIAGTTAPVLILGETGTGKELVARAIHRLSDRKDRPLVKVNCSALPATLAERELFGHVKGAFTDAHKQQVGRFEYADGATLFLDEIGDRPQELQPKLLRALEHGEFERLGSPRTIKVDVRIIAATNRNLEEEIKAGRFREDLYYRLNVFPLSVLPLRERKDDIPLLVKALVQKLGREMGKTFDIIPQNVILKLQSYDWPGNVRELENLIERAMIISIEPKLNIELPEMNLPRSPDKRSLLEVERAHILQALESSRWRIKGTNGAAEILCLKPSTLRYRMQKLNIQRPHKQS